LVSWDLSRFDGKKRAELLMKGDDSKNRRLEIWEGGEEGGKEEKSCMILSLARSAW